MKESELKKLTPKIFKTALVVLGIKSLGLVKSLELLENNKNIMSVATYG